MEPTMLMVVTIIELITKYGIPGMLQIIQQWQVSNPTLEDIQKLRETVKPPETYFQEKTKKTRKTKKTKE